MIWNEDLKKTDTTNKKFLNILLKNNAISTIRYQICINMYQIYFLPSVKHINTIIEYESWYI